MRFVEFRSPNTDPSVPAAWVGTVMALEEDEVCSAQEELGRAWFGELICDQEWDRSLD